MKFTARFFAFFYLISSVGYGVEVHYCLGRISDVSYALFDTYCPCEDAGIGHLNTCCEEKSFFNQLEDEHQSVVSTFVKCSPAFAYIERQYFIMPTERLVDAEIRTFAERGPPIPKDLTIELVRLITYG